MLTIHPGKQTRRPDGTAYGWQPSIISYNLPAQELVALVGLSLWNLRLVRGFLLNPPPAVRPLQRPRRPIVDDRLPPQWPRDPVIQNTLAELDWTRLLANRPEWSRRDGELHCDQDRILGLTTVPCGEHAVDRTGHRSGAWEATEALFLPAAARHFYSAAFVGASAARAAGNRRRSPTTSPQNLLVNRLNRNE